MKVVFNHVGFAPADPKVFLLDAPEATNWRRLEVVSLPVGDVVEVVTPEFAGGVDGWSVGPWWKVDLSELAQPGRYALRWSVDAVDGARHGQSEPFTIAEGALGLDLVSDLLFYFKSQRSSGIWDHADRNAPRVEDGVRRDVRGGWFDASGDTSKYLSHLSYATFMNPQQTPLVVWILARAAQLWKEHGAPGYFVERLRDEALHGADWLVRMQDPEGFWYETLFDRWTKDPAQRELCAYRTQQGIKLPTYRVGWRNGGGLAVAALALASTLGDSADFTAADYRAAALRGFLHLQQHAAKYANDGKQNLLDDTCALLAAVELRPVATETDARALDRELATRSAALLARRRQTDNVVWLRADEAGERSWFHASDAGLPLVVLDRLLEVFPDSLGAGDARELLVELLRSQLELGAAKNNPFVYPPHWVRAPGQAERAQWFYPHENPSGYWWQGENARLGSLAAAVLAASARLDSADPLIPASRSAAHHWISWVLGANPFDLCMMQGHGRNNPSYDPGYHNAPGGICNGITSGFTDEDDLAFLPLPTAHDPAQRWRWSEQWLPHAAWMLHALTLRATRGLK